ncbi:MAG TPA: GNAT family N-acetyltransferase [Rhizomicrobium sp.]|jgi:GNAT superfamily N-acetyltransferase
MRELTFRTAEKRDLAAIIALLADDDIGENREAPAGTISPEYERAFAEMAGCGGNSILLAEHDGEIVGALQLVIVPSLSRQGTKRAMIEAVRVKTDLRGQMVGTKLMRHAIDVARREGSRLIQLTSDKRRKRAHLFYRRLGFEQSHEGFKLELRG